MKLKRYLKNDISDMMMLKNYFVILIALENESSLNTEGSTQFSIPIKLSFFLTYQWNNRNTYKNWNCKEMEIIPQTIFFKPETNNLM